MARGLVKAAGVITTVFAGACTPYGSRPECPRAGGPAWNEVVSPHFRIVTDLPARNRTAIWAMISGTWHLWVRADLVAPCFGKSLPMSSLFRSSPAGPLARAGRGTGACKQHGLGRLRVFRSRQSFLIHEVSG